MKLQSVVRWMVLAAVVFVAAQAFAAPVNLVCTGITDKSSVARITFDENIGTASFGDDPVSAASFTATNIKWSGIFTLDIDGTFNLDRITGVLKVIYYYRNLREGAEYNCVVAEKKF